MGIADGTIQSDFYPRSPCGERLIHPLLCNAKPNFYPRSPCGERPDTLTDDVSTGGISIHALLAESDHIIGHAVNLHPISIHALLAESDL